MREIEGGGVRERREGEEGEEGEKRGEGEEGRGGRGLEVDSKSWQEEEKERGC